MKIYEYPATCSGSQAAPSLVCHSSVVVGSGEFNNHTNKKGLQVFTYKPFFGRCPEQELLSPEHQYLIRIGCQMIVNLR